jgi:DNA-binding IclR family transcriptional regulator
MGSSDELASPVGSVDKALRILQILSTYPHGIILEELVREIGIPRSSLHRLLGALKHRGFAAQPEPNGRYFLGPELLAVAFRFHDQMDLRLLVRPLLIRLQQTYNETVNLGVLSDAEIVYVDKVESSRAVRLTSVIGDRDPASTTGLGKALLAWTYPTGDALAQWAAPHGRLATPTPQSIASLDKLHVELERIRTAGYALDLGENEEGVHCAAVPLFLGGAVPAAAVSVAAPKQRMPLSRLEKIADTLKQTVADGLFTTG